LGFLEERGVRREKIEGGLWHLFYYLRKECKGKYFYIRVIPRLLVLLIGKNIEHGINYQF
jgi:hypothetical protein